MRSISAPRTASLSLVPPFLARQAMRPQTTAEILLKSCPSAKSNFPRNVRSSGALIGSWLRICLATAVISVIRPGLFCTMTLPCPIRVKSTRAPRETNLFANGFRFFSSIAISHPRSLNSPSKDSWAERAEASGSSCVKSSKNSTVVSFSRSDESLEIARLNLRNA